MLRASDSVFAREIEPRSMMPNLILRRRLTGTMKCTKYRQPDSGLIKKTATGWEFLQRAQSSPTAILSSESSATTKNPDRNRILWRRLLEKQTTRPIVLRSAIDLASIRHIPSKREKRRGQVGPKLFVRRALCRKSNKPNRRFSQPFQSWPWTSTMQIRPKVPPGPPGKLGLSGLSRHRDQELEKAGYRCAG